MHLWLVIYFPDPNFEKIVREYIYKPEGEIYKEDVQNVVSISAKNADIVSIEGIQYFDNLKYLLLERNNIKDISMLRNHSQIEYLHLTGNPVQDFSSLYTLKNLKDVKCFGISSIKAYPRVRQETQGRKDFHPGFFVSEPMGEANLLRWKCIFCEALLHIL